MCQIQISGFFHIFMATRENIDRIPGFCSECWVRLELVWVEFYISSLAIRAGVLLRRTNDLSRKYVFFRIVCQPSHWILHFIHYFGLTVLRQPTHMSSTKLNSSLHCSLIGFPCKRQKAVTRTAINLHVEWRATALLHPFDSIHPAHSITQYFDIHKCVRVCVFIIQKNNHKIFTFHLIIYQHLLTVIYYYVNRRMEKKEIKIRQQSTTATEKRKENKNTNFNELVFPRPAISNIVFP